MGIYTILSILFLFLTYREIVAVTVGWHVYELTHDPLALGLVGLGELVLRLLQQLGDDYDIEIVEGHHRFKKDAPSGTALAQKVRFATSAGQ